MAISFDVTDEKGYAARQQEIDAAILKALEEGPKTPHELQTLLFEMKVGNAESSERLALSYSLTGAITRSACNSLRRRQLLTDTMDRYATTGVLEKPFRYYKRDAL
jgi:hypothetical protein